MKIAEILVFIFTFLILVSLSILVYGLSNGWHIKDSKKNEIMIEKPIQITLEEPIGTQIISINTYKELMVLTVSGPESVSQKLILLDPIAGKIHGKILLNNH